MDNERVVAEESKGLEKLFELTNSLGFCCYGFALQVEYRKIAFHSSSRASAWRRSGDSGVQMIQLQHQLGS